MENEKISEGEIVDEQKPGKALATQEPGKALPAFPTGGQIQEYENFLKNYNSFIDSQLKDKVDYGIIPGVDKPSLFKPGAEKLEKLMFLTHEKVLVEKIVEPYFIKYTYRTIVYDKSGRIKATCEGTCNSKEKKYRYTTCFENEATAAQKANGERIQKTSKNGKPYFIIKVEKNDFYDLENTIMKMAQKRSYVGAILEATNSSGRFTQDVEDIPIADSNKTAYTPSNKGYKTYKPNNQYNRPITPNNALKSAFWARIKAENGGQFADDARAVEIVEQKTGIRLETVKGITDQKIIELNQAWL